MGDFAKRCGASVLVFLFVSLKHNVAYGVGEEVGRIVGRVTEAQTGAPVPGAAITVTGTPLIGPARRTTTDDDGGYEIPNLAPGSYRVEVSYAGVKPIRKRLEVLPSVATPLNIAWSAELTQAETTVVEEERHATRPDSTMTGSVFSIAKLQNGSIGRNYRSVLNQAAGVIGGSNSGLRGAISPGTANVRGATTRQNRYFVDGLDITDVVTNSFRGNVQFDAAESIQVITGGFEAKYNAIGALTNIITQSGSDEFHFNALALYGPNALQSFVASGRQTYDEQRPFADEAPPPLKDIQGSFVVGGPILKHRLWYNASFFFIRNSTAQAPGPPLSAQAPNWVIQSYRPRLKLTWALAARHRIWLQGFADPTTFDFFNNNSAEANTTEPLAAFTQNQGGWNIMGEWDYFISENLDTKLLAGFQTSGMTTGAQGKVRSLDPKYGIYDFNRPRHQNLRDGSVWGNQLTYSEDTRPKFQIDGSATWRTRLLGLHEFEAGFNGQFSQFTNTVTQTAGGVSYVDNSPSSGAPLNQGLCDDDPFVRAGRSDADTITGVGCFQKIVASDYKLGTSNFNFGFYAQDRWKPTRWFTVMAGLRWDFYQVRIRSDGPLPYGDRLQRYGFGPRAGVIFDLTGDQKTILQASYGRATQPIYAQAVTQVQQLNTQSSSTYTWNSQTQRFENPQQNSGAGTAFLDTKSTTPAHSDEILVRLSREVFKNSLLEVDYVCRRISNIFERVEVNRIWDPSGSRVVGFVNPAVPSPIFLSTYPDQSYTKYSGFDLIFESRPSPMFDFQGSYTLAWTWGPTFDDNQPSNQYANPRQQQLYNGFALDIDTRHTLKTNTSFLYRGLIVGLLVNWFSGTPQRKEFNPVSNSYPTRFRSPFGTEPGTPNDIRAWTEFRLPPLLDVGLTVGYDFHELIRQHLIFTFRVANLLDLTTPIAFNRVDNNSFGTVSARQPARRVTLGLEYRY